MASLSLALEFACAGHVGTASPLLLSPPPSRRHFFPQVICVRAVEGAGRYQQRHSQQRRRGGVCTLGFIPRRCSQQNAVATSLRGAFVDVEFARHVGASASDTPATGPIA